MRVAIVGAGIVGVAPAYELAAPGMAVSVFDRVDAARARHIEPALQAQTPLHAALHLPQDGAAVVARAQHWKGARAMRPDGPPVLGDSGATGVWLNVGHGDGGGTLACGAARVLAETLAGRAAPLDLDGLTVARLR